MKQVALMILTISTIALYQFLKIALKAMHIAHFSLPFIIITAIFAVCGIVLAYEKYDKHKA